MHGGTTGTPSPLLCLARAGPRRYRNVTSASGVLPSERGRSKVRNSVLSAVLGVSMLFAGSAPVAAHAATYRHRHSRYYRHKAHRKTAKRVGIGAAGGAVIGALAGGGRGAAIGAGAGAGAGYLYDRHEKHESKP